MSPLLHSCTPALLIRVLPFYIASAALLLTLSGCIEEYEADISTEDSNLLVVEGTICSSSFCKFTLTRTQAITSDDTSLNAQRSTLHQLPSSVIGAIVSVRGTDGSEYVAQESPGNIYTTVMTDGSYNCWVGELSPDVAYYLHIEADGEVYESEPQKPLPTEQIAEVSGVQNTLENSVDVLVTPAAPFSSDQTNYYSWTYDETWQVFPDCKNDNMYFDTTLLRGVFKAHQFPEYGWKDGTSSTIMVGSSASYEGQHIEQLKIYDIDLGDERIYGRYSGLLHQRAITKAEYEYELARLQAGTEMGGLFTPLPSALPTNIRCLTSSKHVIGYVGCSLNTSDYRFFLDSDDFPVQYPHEDVRLWVINPPNMNYLCRLVNEGYFLCVWQDDRLSGGDLKTAWAYEYQLDVRFKGAYIEEPDFWISDK